MNLNDFTAAGMTFMFLIVPVGAESDIFQITYISSIDPDLGFYKITDSTTHKSPIYVNRTLTINQGDTVIWKNDGDKPGNITIVSEQKLFTNRLLMLIGDLYSYSFNKPGKYKFHIRERETAYQIIVVNRTLTDTIPTNVPTTSPTITSTIIPTVIPNISTPKPIVTNVINVNINDTNITNRPGNVNGNISILKNIISRIDINRIINDYIAGILIIITYIIYKNRSKKYE